MASNTTRALKTAVVLAVLTAPATALAQSPAKAEIDALRAQMLAIQQRLDALERQSAEGSAAPAPAPSPVPTPAPAGDAVATPVDEKPEVPRGPIARALGGLGSQVELLAASESSRATFKASTRISSTRLGGKATGWGTSTNLTASISAPLSEGEPRTEVWTHDGFANDFQVTLGLTKFQRRLANPFLDPQLLALAEDARTACKRKKTPEECKVEEAANEGDAFIGLHLGQAKRTEYLNRAVSPAAHAFGAELSVGTLEHEYIAPATVTNESVSDMPWGLKTYYAYLPDRDTSYAMSLQYVEELKDQDAGVRCPMPPATPFSCLQGAIGRPENTQKLLWGLEYRRLFDLGFSERLQPLFRSVGIAPQLLYDSENDVTSVDLPVYFVTNDKGEYIGGVRFGWTSEEHDIAVGLFINQAFSIRP